MTSMFPANPAWGEGQRSWQERLDAMKARWVNKFADHKPSSRSHDPTHDPVFDNDDMVQLMVDHFNKKQQSMGGFTISKSVDEPVLSRVMSEYFTERFKEFEQDGNSALIIDGKPRHKLIFVRDELSKNEVRNTIISQTSTNNQQAKNSEFSARNTITTLQEHLPNVKPSLPKLTVSASSIALGLKDRFQPQITNFKEAYRGFSFKRFAEDKVNSVVESGKALKKSYQDDRAGTLKSVAIGAGTGIALKAAFNTAAVASGVGIIAAVGYGLTKTFQEEYKKSKGEGNTFWQNLKNAGNTKVGLNLLKRSATHSAFFGLGFGVGAATGPSDILPEKVETPTPVQETIVEDTLPPGVKRLVLLSELPPEELEAMRITPEPTIEPVIELTAVQQKLAGLEGMTPEILESLKDASPQDIKDEAVQQLWRGGDQTLGGLLMEKAAEMGNPQALNDVVALRDMGILPKLEDLDTRLADLDIPQDINDHINHKNPRIAAQGYKDLGAALLNGKGFMNLGIEKNFSLGVDILDKAAEMGNPQAINDLTTLVDYGMISQDTLGTKVQTLVQMKLALLNDGALAACSRSLETCSFSESAINNAVAQSTEPSVTNAALKEVFLKTYQSAIGDNDIVPFTAPPKIELAQN